MCSLPLFFGDDYSVVCGGGPTGVEFASELIDMMNEDALTYVSVPVFYVSMNGRRLSDHDESGCPVP